MSSGDLRLALIREALGLRPDDQIPGALPAWRDNKPCAGRTLGLSRAKTYELCQQGTFPVPLLPYGGNGKNDYRVSTFRVLQLLGLDGEGRVDAQGSSAEVLPFLASAGESPNGRHEGEEPLVLRSTLGAGGSSSSGDSQ